MVKRDQKDFLNNLYKTGNVIIYRSYAKITPQLKNYMKALSSDIKVEVPNAPKMKYLGDIISSIH